MRDYWDRVDEAIQDQKYEEWKMQQWTQLSDSPSGPRVRRDGGSSLRGPGIQILDAAGDTVYLCPDEAKALAKFLLSEAVEKAAEEVEAAERTVARRPRIHPDGGCIHTHSQPCERCARALDPDAHLGAVEG